MRKTMIILWAIPALLLAKAPFIPIEAGKIIDKAPNGWDLGFKLLAEKVETTNLYNVVVYSIDPMTGHTNQITKCDRADVEQNGNGVLAINLRNVTVEQHNTNGTITTITATLYPMRFDITSLGASNQASEAIAPQGGAQPQR